MTHQIAGVGLAAVAVAALDVSTATGGALLGAAWLGSILPDADLARGRVHRRSLIERRVPVLRLVGTVARLSVRWLVVFPHRGLTHSLAACAVATVFAGGLVSFVDPQLGRAAAAGVVIGYGTHLAADACTISGVRAWAPFSRKRRWLLPARARIRTGSVREYVVAALLLVLLSAATVLLIG
jgi:membrane-bound metal-dependent hydrolase YbcI (DUF457 family)